MSANPAQNRSSSEKEPFTARFKDELKLANLFRSASNINELLNGLKQEMRDYFDVAAFTIYFADNKKKQIVSKVKAGRLRKEIRLPIDKTSIAGFVAATGEIVNIFTGKFITVFFVNELDYPKQVFFAVYRGR
jgi:transcriptional regulator with GAF, ATPase, and Fis domain